LQKYLQKDKKTLDILYTIGYTLISKENGPDNRLSGSRARRYLGIDLEVLPDVPPRMGSGFATVLQS